MRGFKSFLMLALVVVVAFIMITAMTAVARAEEPTDVNSVVEDRIYNTYNEYSYPTGNTMFYLPRRHEVKFDIHNGKFFQVFYLPQHNNTITTYKELSAVEYKVFFFTPVGKLFGIRKVSFLDYNRYHSIPHDDRSPNYERLIVKIQNNTEFNKNFCFKVLDPVEPVKGTPIKGTKYRVILLD